jgi:predicted ATPase
MESIVRENASLRIMMQDLQARRQCEELPLSFLNERAVDGYLERRFPKHAFPGDMTRWLQEKTAGNPLFIAALIDHMIAQEHIVRRDETYALPMTLDRIDLTIPSTIQQVIERQIEICSPPERRLLLAASVVGREFSVSEIAAVLGEKVDRIDLLCRNLSNAKRFLRPVNLSHRAGIRSGMYVFVHPLFQATCCQMLPSHLRIRLQKRIARLVASTKSRTEENAALIA